MPSVRLTWSRAPGPAVLRVGSSRATPGTARTASATAPISASRLERAFSRGAATSARPGSDIVKVFDGDVDGRDLHADLLEHSGDDLRAELVAHVGDDEVGRHAHPQRHGYSGRTDVCGSSTGRRDRQLCGQGRGVLVEGEGAATDLDLTREVTGASDDGGDSLLADGVQASSGPGSVGWAGLVRAGLVRAGADRRGRSRGRRRPRRTSARATARIRSSRPGLGTRSGLVACRRASPGWPRRGRRGRRARRDSRGTRARGRRGPGRGGPRPGRCRVRSRAAWTTRQLAPCVHSSHPGSAGPCDPSTDGTDGQVGGVGDLGVGQLVHLP